MERIWVFQGNYTEEDAKAAVNISIAEMLLTGTTCFLESMVSNLTYLRVKIPYFYSNIDMYSLQIDTTLTISAFQSRSRVSEDV